MSRGRRAVTFARRCSSVRAASSTRSDPVRVDELVGLALALGIELQVWSAPDVHVIGWRRRWPAACWGRQSPSAVAGRWGVARRGARVDGAGRGRRSGDRARARRDPGADPGVLRRRRLPFRAPCPVGAGHRPGWRIARRADHDGDVLGSVLHNDHARPGAVVGWARVARAPGARACAPRARRAARQRAGAARRARGLRRTGADRAGAPRRDRPQRVGDGDPGRCAHGW